MKYVVAVAVVLGGCTPEKPPVLDDKLVAEVNAMLPEPQRATFQFVSRTLDVPGKRGLRYLVAAPKDWRRDGSDTLKAPSAIGDTQLWLASSCGADGLATPWMLGGQPSDKREPCVPRDDWDAVVDQVIATSYLNVLNVEKAPQRRVVFATGGAMNPEARSVTVYWWQRGGSELFECSARLGHPSAVAAANAFAKACESVVVTSLGGRS